MAHISSEEIRKLGILSAIRLKEQETMDMASMVQSVLTYAESLAAVDTDNDRVTHDAVVHRTCWMRPDTVHVSPVRQQIMQQAPCGDGTFFIVPVIIKAS
jgi:aspartyl/glutamyl-tRNA(Asn/Gln) amidotransferase C subunit